MLIAGAVTLVLFALRPEDPATAKPAGAETVLEVTGPQSS
jgi:hypothetical protein